MGRPPALNDNEKNALVNEVTKNRREPLHEGINKLGLSCSLTTAKQTLYDAGIHSHVAAKKPFISKKHASARVSWCEKYKEKLLVIGHKLFSLMNQVLRLESSHDK